MQNLGTNTAIRIGGIGEGIISVVKFVLILLIPEIYNFIDEWLNHTPGYTGFGLSVDAPPPKSRKEIEQEENSFL